MVADSQSVSRTLVHAVLHDHPDWARHVPRCEPEEDTQTESGRLLMSVRAGSRHTAWKWQQEGDTFEVTYDCGLASRTARKSYSSSRKVTTRNSCCRADVPQPHLRRRHRNRPRTARADLPVRFGATASPPEISRRSGSPSHRV